MYVRIDDVPRPTLEPSSGPSSSRPTTQNIPKESTSSRKVSGSLVEYKKYIGESCIYDIVNLLTLQKLIQTSCCLCLV